MSSPIITVENLSKRFVLSHEGSESYTALRDVVANKAKSMFSIKKSRQSVEEFWALNDVNFSINQGARVGIIGRNGAGKSTLLKILSRITEPTSGRITIKGRVASLLEVGTGFHPELTGRENIFLNGAILGMSRNEIRRKFDEIVDFAEVEQFLDTPVKRFSSGMYVRLAFAVAAHLEPEILIVDEVLAVGDAQFQKKCLGKMEDVSRKDGRTVLFVSHNMIAIQQLCNDIIVMHKGIVLYHGDRSRGLVEYEKLNREISLNPTDSETSIKFQISSSGKLAPESLTGNSPLTFEVEINAHKSYGKSWVNFIIDNNELATIAHMRNDWYNETINIEKGKTTVKVEVPDISLSPGIYTIWCRVVLSEEILIFDSEPSYLEVTGKHLYGNIAYNVDWKISYS
jgi:lipopolysaccharide transport system ATP-binding protein